MPDPKTNGKVDEHVARYLLHHSHEYRELIRERVSAARKAWMVKDKAIARSHLARYDVDLLGRDIDGCG